jgi:hypothetical protein
VTQPRRPRRQTPSRAPDLPGREWRQFRLLTRDSWRRLLDSLVFARDTDPMQFVLFAVALATTLPLMRAVQKVIHYGFLANAPVDAVLPQVLADRLFLLTYGMLTSALLAALMWDALFPDRTDQEIVGVLPVRPRTLAAARLTAAVGTALAFAAAINVPSGLIFALAQSSLPQLGSLPRLLAGHLVSTMLASTFVFLGLMSLRGILAVCAGERAASRLALLLQLVTVVSFVEVFMFLPGILPALVRELRNGVGGYTFLPPVWFGALYSWMAEGQGLRLPLARVALWATALVVAVVTAVSLVPAAWMGRRVLETSARERAGGLLVIARTVAAITIRSAPIRGMFLFAVASLTRSRRHALVLATYLGLAIAISIVGLISSSYFDRLIVDRPVRYVLALPMVFTFFAVFGLRVACALPTDVDANWPFRLAQPTARQAVSVCRRLILTLGVAPITIVWLAITLMLWPAADALRASAFLLVSGVALAEAVLANWTKVPFAAAHEPAASTMRSRWPLNLFALHMFGFMLASAQMQALRAPNGTRWYLGIGVGLVLVLRLKRELSLDNQTPTLDASDPHSVEVLNLSEASS